VHVPKQHGVLLFYLGQREELYDVLVSKKFDFGKKIILFVQDRVRQTQETGRNNII
jgi:hypothetical protein